MHFGWSKTLVSPIAIDFGADSLKLLQILPTDPPQLLVAAAAELPEAARTDPAARHAFFSDSLRALLAAQPFKGRRVICSIPAYQTLIQHVQIPTDQQDLDTQIGLHLRERLNIEPARMVVRHFVVGPITRDGATKLEVICLAASRDTILRHLETARRAKLDVIGMHCEPLAILQAFAHLYRRDDDAARTTCFIDLGAATTKVAISHGCTMVFAKAIHAAGDHFNRHRAKAAGISFTEARRQRMEEAANPAAKAPEPAEAMVAAAAKPPRATGGLAALDAQIAAERRAAGADEVEEAQEAGSLPKPRPITELPGPGRDSDTLDCLIDELQLSLRYHQSMFPQRPVDKLVFLGGEAHHTATCQAIARALRIGAQLGDPLARLVRASQTAKPAGVDMRRPQPGWAVPFGLCLSEANL